VSLLDQLECAIEQERSALVRGDWSALQLSVTSKGELADQLALTGLTPGELERTRQLRRLTRHNAELASTLMRQVGRLMAQHQTASVYDRGGQMNGRLLGLMSLQG